MHSPWNVPSSASPTRPLVDPSRQCSRPHSNAHVEQIEALAEAAAGLEASVPAQVSVAVRDGLRTEVLPVARHIAEMRGLLNQAIRRLERIEGELLAERHARVDDLALLVDLVSSGWRGIDARLARLERDQERACRSTSKSSSGTQQPRSAYLRVDLGREERAGSGFRCRAPR